MATSVEQGKGPKKAGNGAVDEKRQRWRSPEYPSIGLRSAVDLAGKIWDKEKRSQMSTEVAFKHMGFASRSGAAVRAVAALKKFGLLVQPNPGRVQISDEGIQVMVRPPDDPHRVELLQRMAQRPDIFREILRRFPDGLPSEQNLRTELIAELHFSEDAAGTLISVLKETLELVDLHGLQGDGRPTPTPEMTASGAAFEVPVAPSRGRVPAAGGGNDGSTTIQVWTLGGGTVVELRSNRPLTASQYDLLAQYVALAKQAETVAVAAGQGVS